MNQVAGLLVRDADTVSGDAGSFQRWAALIGGGSLALVGLTRRSKSGVAMAAAGGLLAYVGATADRIPRVIVASSSVLVNCSPQEAYQFWRNFENLPLFMRHLESVSVSGDKRTTWIALGPLGTRITWDAEIVTERANEVIEWQALPGSRLRVDGSVEFRSAPANRGTIIQAMMRFRPPSGGVGRAVAKIFGKYPNFVMRQDLRRFKALVETGEIPTTEGQTHGPRSLKIAALRLADPDRPLRPESRITEVLNALRRIA